MKRQGLWGVVTLVAWWAAGAEPSSKGLTQVLVRVDGHDGESSYQLMAPEEADKLEQTIKKEAALFSKALAAAEKAWKANEETARKPFPRSAVNPRKITRIQTFTDLNKAQERLADLEVKTGNRGQKSAAQKQTRDRLLGKTKEAIAREAQREAERERLEAEALALFEAKLASLMEPASAETPPKAATDEKFGR